MLAELETGNEHRYTQWGPHCDLRSSFVINYMDSMGCAFL